MNNEKILNSHGLFKSRHLFSRNRGKYRALLTSLFEGKLYKIEFRELSTTIFKVLYPKDVSSEWTEGLTVTET